MLISLLKSKELVAINLEIFKRVNTKNRLQFVVNDRMNIDKNKNRILFEISSLSIDNHKIKTVEYFMNIEDCKYLCHLILNDKLSNNFSKVRGKEGKARGITISRKIYENKFYYSIKIDKGFGTSKSNGFTNFESKEEGLYFNISSEDMIKLCLTLKDRIFQRELLFINNFFNNN